jgi:hypothetical protein
MPTYGEVDLHDDDDKSSRDDEGKYADKDVD